MSVRVNRRVLSDPSWIQWAVTGPLLAAHQVLGQQGALAAVIVICALMAVAYSIAARSARDFRVQVRLGFLAVIGLGLIPGWGLVLWLPLVGTSAQVLVGFCPMARTLRLMPWNRGEALTIGFARDVVFGPRGNDGLIAAR